MHNAGDLGAGVGAHPGVNASDDARSMCRRVRAAPHNHDTRFINRQQHWAQGKELCHILRVRAQSAKLQFTNKALALACRQRSA